MQKIRQRMNEDKVAMLAAVGRVMHQNLIQIIGLQGGFQGVWIDHEHVGFSLREMEIAALAARSVGLDCFARIAPTDYALVTKCLEAGAGGVMAAMIHSAAQAEEFVQWATFAPRGNRGLNTSGYDGGYATRSPKDFVAHANRESFVAIQIETLGALEECEAIAAIDGVDLLFIGPSDLSQALGVTGDFMHEKCIAAVDRVAAACKSAGKHWGAVCMNPEHGQMFIDRGCRMLSPTSDTKIINAGVAATKTTYANYFGA